MIVVDASVWVSNALVDDAFHVISRTWLRTNLRRGDPLHGLTLVLTEVSEAIARQSGDGPQADLAVREMEALSGLHLLDIDPVLAREAAYLASDLQLRGADVIYIATAARLGCSLVTWDNEMLEPGGQVIDVRQPSA